MKIKQLYKRGKKMYLLVITVLIGIIIGAFTNALAIKMLFRPFKPIKIGSYKMPFTPGLIPKRRAEIAEQLGLMVEKYLFTAKGMKQFVEKSALDKKILLRLNEKVKVYQTSDNKLGEILDKYIDKDWRKGLIAFGHDQLDSLLVQKKISKMTVNELLTMETIHLIESKLPAISDFILHESNKYFHTIEGKRLLEALIDQFLEGKKMLGFFAGFLIERNHFQEKLLLYMEELLMSTPVQNRLNDILDREWNKLIEQPINEIINNIDHIIKIEAESILNQGVSSIENIKISNIASKIEAYDLLEKGYHSLSMILFEKMDKMFSYLSISQVVKEEVNRFSLEELEKMILDIAEKELKMITYFGGLLGGLIGFFQGMLYIFF